MNELKYIIVMCINSKPIVEMGFTKDLKIHEKTKEEKICYKQMKYLLVDYKSPSEIGTNHKAIEKALPVTFAGKILSNQFCYYQINLAECEQFLSKNYPLTKLDKKILEFGSLLQTTNEEIFMEKLKALELFNTNKNINFYETIYKAMYE